MNYQVEPEHYLIQYYDNKERFISYWHQINEIITLKPQTILEIGMGNGFVAKYLKDRKFNIITLDIDTRLKPDIAGNVLALPFYNGVFSLVSCCEVLEHLPYHSFITTISELVRVSRFYIVLSLPDITPAYRLYLHIPKLIKIKQLLTIPGIRKICHEFDGYHYWEIGKDKYPLNRIINDIKEVKPSVEIIKTYRIFEHHNHRFFILKKK